MLLTVRFGNNRLAWTVEPPDQRLGPLRPPTNERVLRHFAPSVPERRLRSVAAYITYRGWLRERVYHLSPLTETLAQLDVTVDPGQLCAVIARLMAEEARTVLTTPSTQAVVDITVRDSLLGDDGLPQLSLDVPPVIAVDGRIFRLQPVHHEATDVISLLREELQQRAAEHNRTVSALARQMSEEVERRIAEAELRLLERDPMPFISAGDVAAGLRVRHGDPISEGGGIFFYLPFHYRPRYIIPRSRPGEYYLIDEEQALALERRLLIRFYRLRNGSWDTPSLVDEQLEEFDHYHRRCWGNIDFHSALTGGQLPGVLYDLRDRMQWELEIINGPGLARSHPGGLIGFDQLRHSSWPQASRQFGARGPSPGSGAGYGDSEAAGQGPAQPAPRSGQPWRV